MRGLSTFRVNLKTLKEGLNTLEFDVDDHFFQTIDVSEVQKGRVQVTLRIERVKNIFTLDFYERGTVIIPCDRCLDDMEQPIDTHNRLIAKFGEEEMETGDFLVIDEKLGLLDVSWLIYEFIALAIPIKHVHEEGKCNPLMMEKLQEHVVSHVEESAEEENDPRWDALKKLKH